jgi:hypothetical protein
MAWFSSFPLGMAPVVVVSCPKNWGSTSYHLVQNIQSPKPPKFLQKKLLIGFQPAQGDDKADILLEFPAIT